MVAKKPQKKPKKQPTKKQPLSTEEFWSIVATVARIAAKSGDAVGTLRVELEKLSPEELIAYQRHFDEFHAKAYRWEIWGAAYLLEGGCSDDGFTDFRYSLIMKGRGVYERALQRADSLAGSDIIGDESLGYVALEVYEEKTGSEMPRAEWSQSSEPAGKSWDFDDEAENLKRLPRVTRAAR
jgi:hypothetical protein